MKRRNFLKELAALGVAIPVINHLPKDVKGTPSRLHEADEVGQTKIRGNHLDHMVIDDYSEFKKCKCILKIGKHKIAARGNAFRIDRMRRNMIEITQDEYHPRYIPGKRETKITLNINKILIPIEDIQDINTCEIIIETKGETYPTRMIRTRCSVTGYKIVIVKSHLIQLDIQNHDVFLT